MKAKELLKQINEELKTEENSRVKEILKERQKEIRRIKKLLRTSESEYNDLLEMEVEDILDNDDFDY
jgi:DNA-binding protein H-NS